MSAVVHELPQQEVQRGRQAFFGWDSRAGSPRPSPSPCEEARPIRIQYLRLDLSSASTAATSSGTDALEVTADSLEAATAAPASKASQSRFKLQLPPPDKADCASETTEGALVEHVDTPSTTAGSGTPRLTSRRQSYIGLAGQLLEAGRETLMAAGRDPQFAEALARQGLEVADLLASSGLSAGRRTMLLAAVLQEKDVLQHAPDPLQACKARVLHKQLVGRVDELAARIASHQDHHEAVSRRGQAHADERSALHEARQQEERERQRRVRARDEAATEMRRGRSRERDAQWQAAVARGTEIAEARSEDRREFLRQQDERTNQCLDRREEARAAQRQHLQERHQAVQQAVEAARQEANLQAQHWEENWHSMLRRSEVHMEAVRAAQERRVEQRRQESREREHEVIRVARAQAYARYCKAVQQEEDSTIFKECSRLRENLAVLARAKAAERTTDAE